MTALEETEYNFIIALRNFAKSLRELKNTFFQKSVFTLLSLVNYLLSRFLKVLKNRIRQYFITYNLKT